jgi:hypothetical protein
MDISIEQRVANGAKLLDECEPRWFTVVDLEMLSITSTGTCILGQVYGGFVAGCRELGIEGDRAEEERLGFELTHEEYNSEFCPGIEEQIEDAWCAHVEARRIAASMTA